MPLTADRVGSTGAAHTLVMLHGIYGRGRNWLTIARMLASARADYACWLVDLPHHGDSGAGRHGDTVTGLAGDVLDWMASAGIEPAAVLGHSFGGKVALAVAGEGRRTGLHVWVVDSTPAPTDPSGSAWDLLQTVRRLPARFESRHALVSALAAEGWTMALSQWMASNVVREGDAFVWRLDFDAMERLLDSFFTTDLWHVLETPAPGQVFQFIKATASNTMREQAVARAMSLPRERVVVHALDGGHWIHAEQPQAVVDLLARHLPPVARSR
jgi:pimeloyl-ACP methyl ester carboxylesterase